MKDEPADSLAQTLVAIGRGDKTALDTIIAQSGGTLFALCLRITGSRVAAEDVFQETMIKVWNRAAAFDPARSSAMSWLATIARNSAIDWYRAHHRRSFVSDAQISPIADEAEAVPDRIIREEREHRALTLLSELPEDQEMEIRSIFFEGLTYPELAAREGLPLSTLKSRVRRALLALRKKLDDE